MAERRHHNSGAGNGQSKLTEDDVLEMRQRYAQGESTYALGAEFGVTDATAGKAISGRSWASLPNAQPMRTSSEHSRALGDDDVLEIRRRAATGESFVTIGRSFEMSAENIRLVARGVNYPHLPTVSIPLRKAPKRPSNLSLVEMGAWALTQTKAAAAPEGRHYALLEGDCLLWTRGRKHGDHDYAQVRGVTTNQVHRMVLAAATGLSEAELGNVEVVEHLCDRPACIQPAHLLPSTHAANQRGMYARERRRP